VRKEEMVWDDRRDLRNALLVGGATTLVLGSMLFATQAGTGVLQIPTTETAILAACAALVTLLGLAALRTKLTTRVISWVVLLAYTLIVSLTVHFTGGPLTPMPALYLLVVVAASFLLGRQGDGKLKLNPPGAPFHPPQHQQRSDADGDESDEARLGAKCTACPQIRPLLLDGDESDPTVCSAADREAKDIALEEVPGHVHPDGYSKISSKDIAKAQKKARHHKIDGANCGGIGIARMGQTEQTGGEHPGKDNGNRGTPEFEIQGFCEIGQKITA